MWAFYRCLQCYAWDFVARRAFALTHSTESETVMWFLDFEPGLACESTNKIQINKKTNINSKKKFCNNCYYICAHLSLSLSLYISLCFSQQVSKRLRIWTENRKEGLACDPNYRNRLKLMLLLLLVLSNAAKSGLLGQNIIFTLAVKSKVNARRLRETRRLLFSFYSVYIHVCTYTRVQIILYLHMYVLKRTRFSSWLNIRA